jgi:hypothetical protein
MAGLVPATHALLAAMPKDVGARDKPGHDAEVTVALIALKIQPTN